MLPVISSTLRAGKQAPPVCGSPPHQCIMTVCPTSMCLLLKADEIDARIHTRQGLRTAWQNLLSRVIDFDKPTHTHTYTRAGTRTIQPLLQKSNSVPQDICICLRSKLPAQRASESQFGVPLSAPNPLTILRTAHLFHM